MADWNQAGHYFVDGKRCACGRYWVDIRNTQRSQINEYGIAHTGHLTTGEYVSIEKRRNAEDKAHDLAMAVVSGRRVEEEAEPAPDANACWLVDYNDMVEF